MLETIFYYTGWVTLILLSIILNIVIIYRSLVWIQNLSKKIRVLSIMFVSLSKMTKEERRLSDSFYESFFNWKKWESEKYFK